MINISDHFRCSAALLVVIAAESRAIDSRAVLLDAAVARRWHALSFTEMPGEEFSLEKPRKTSFGARSTMT